MPPKRSYLPTSSYSVETQKTNNDIGECSFSLTLIKFLAEILELKRSLYFNTYKESGKVNELTGCVKKG